MRSIGVVGGGIIGLATTQAILEDFHNVKITIYSSEYSPNTTADLSAGLILPYLYGEKENIDDIIRWMNSTVEHLLNAAAKDDILSQAINQFSGYIVSNHAPIELPRYFQECLTGLRKVGKQELTTALNKPHNYCDAIFFSTLTCDCKKYLSHIMTLLRAKGVQFVTEKVYSLDAIADKGQDVVVNACGVGAKVLGSDESLQPIKGQVLEVEAPWIKQFVMEYDDDSYVIPCNNVCIVGGSHAEENSLKIDETLNKKMWTRACEMLPSVRTAKILKACVGLRPGRPSIRMEASPAVTKSGKRYTLLHHYGHGGSGVTLHWGCAKSASSILRKYLDSRGSKL